MCWVRRPLEKPGTFVEGGLPFLLNEEHAVFIIKSQYPISILVIAGHHNHHHHCRQVLTAVVNPITRLPSYPMIAFLDYMRQL